jgi:hypothetical protein
MYYKFAFPFDERGAKISGDEGPYGSITIYFGNSPPPVSDEPFLGLVFNMCNSSSALSFTLNGSEVSAKITRCYCNLVFAPRGFGSFSFKGKQLSILTLQFNHVFLKDWLDRFPVIRPFFGDAPVILGENVIISQELEQEIRWLLVPQEKSFPRDTYYAGKTVAILSRCLELTKYSRESRKKGS